MAFSLTEKFFGLNYFLKVCLNNKGIVVDEIRVSNEKFCFSKQNFGLAKYVVAVLYIVKLFYLLK